MKVFFINIVEALPCSVPARVRFRRWQKNAGYYGLRVRRHAERYSNETPPLPPLPERDPQDAQTPGGNADIGKEIHALSKPARAKERKP